MGKGLLCLFGKHDWRGCKCRKCGLLRDERHEWTTGWGSSTQRCKCLECGTTRNIHHDFRKNCSVCSVCGKTLSEEDTQHQWWGGCKCHLCGREREHLWAGGCTCTRCHLTRDEGHDWRGCKCARCHSTRDEGHDWKGCKCARCHLTNDEGHDWGHDCTTCRLCYKRRVAEHDWTQDCRNCARCHESQETSHVWRDGRCTTCSMTEKEYQETVRYREVQEAARRGNGKGQSLWEIWLHRLCLTVATSGLIRRRARRTSSYQ